MIPSRRDEVILSRVQVRVESRLMGTGVNDKGREACLESRQAVLACRFLFPAITMGFMRIGIDARMMTTGVSRGIGRYIEELVRALLTVAPQHTYVLIVRQNEHPFRSHPSVQTVVADIPWYGFSEQILMPLVLYRLQVDVIHIPHWNVPLLFWKTPCVLTIHDVLLRREPVSAKISTRQPWLALLKRWGYLLTLRWAVWRARSILVPTQAVAEDVRFFYPDSASKLVITGEGMPRPEGKASLAEDPAAALSNPHKYLLYVGSAYPHKGLEFLLACWPEIQDRFPDLHLSVVGSDDLFMRRLRESASAHGLRQIDFLGYVPDDRLPELYGGAQAFVFPSRIEGFGLPPLEALAAGCPVVCSDIPVLREVLGEDAVFFFRPGSQAAILEALQRLFSDPRTHRRRASLAAADLRKRHDWRKTARITLQSYQSVCAHASTVPHS